jgi:hypothetical protein
MLAVVGACSSGSSSPSGNTSPSTSTSTSSSAGACAAVPADPAAKPPPDVPTPTDAAFYRTVKAGSTTLYFANAPGDQVRERRDAIVTLLKNAGYTIKGEDAEANEEAEAEFDGKSHGDSSIQVKHREGCQTQLRIRYRLAG